MNTLTPTREFWTKLVCRPWQRMKWRKTASGDGHCLGCRHPIHRAGTYYLRPAYTDGTDWLCHRCYQTMKQTEGKPASNTYGRRNEKA